MKKYIILVFVLIFAFTVSGFNYEDKKVQSDTTAVKAQTNTLDSSLTDLLKEKNPQLKIRAGNGSSFKATQYMTSRVMEMLNRTTQAPTADKSENVECDVRLSFNGFKDINLNSKTGQFWFNGELTSYTIDSWSDQYFKRAMLKEVDGQVMYDSFEKDILQQNTITDVDNDGTPDEIKLYYDGDIRLKVKNQDIPVSLGVINNAVSSNVPSNMYTCNLYIKGTPGQYQSPGRFQFLVGIDYAFVMKYGSSSVLKCIQYENGNLSETWCSDNEIRKGSKILDFKGDIIDVQIGSKVNKMRLNSDEITDLKKYINNYEESNGKFSWDKFNLDFPLITEYRVLDYDNDRNDELITKTITYAGATCIRDALYTIYSFTDKGVVFKDSFFDSYNNSLEKIFNLS